MATISRTQKRNERRSQKRLVKRSQHVDFGDNFLKYVKDCIDKQESLSKPLRLTNALNIFKAVNSHLPIVLTKEPLHKWYHFILSFHAKSEQIINDNELKNNNDMNTVNLLIREATIAKEFTSKIINDEKERLLRQADLLRQNY